MITHVKLQNFKNIVDFDTDVDKINVLVGGNNSGKSSVLQGIHFSILAEAVRRNMQVATIPETKLLYSPSSDFTLLRHDVPYTVSSGYTSKLTLFSDACSDGANADTFSITISKGRNFGNISVTTQNNNPFRQMVTTYPELYSMYVPGLSGVPLQEKLQSRSVIRSGAANGDANLYLRNIIYYLSQDRKLHILNKYLNRVFPNCNIVVPYKPERDVDIQVALNSRGKTLPIELSGTGFLQITQILAYVLYFSPKLLLLDEPDEHLHPNNQTMLAEVLCSIAEELNTQIIISTHSRHLLGALEDEARFVWLQDGRVKESDACSNKYEILLDIGALDSYDKIVQGTYNCIVLTEDKKIKMIKKLLQINGYNMGRTLIVPFKGCSNTEAAIQLADFIHSSAPECKIIIHRDRDFMTEEEVGKISQKITSRNTYPFITQGSDIEAYFINSDHLASVLERTSDEIGAWLDELATRNHVEIQHKFETKRLEIKNSAIYRDNREAAPSTTDLLTDEIPTPERNRMGKYMLKKVNGDMHTKWGVSKDVVTASPRITIEALQQVLEML